MKRGLLYTNTQVGHLIIVALGFGRAVLLAVLVFVDFHEVGALGWLLLALCPYLGSVKLVQLG